MTDYDNKLSNHDKMNFQQQHILLLLQLVETYEVNVAELCKKVGWDYFTLFENEKEFEQDEIEMFWKRCVEETKEPELGLKLGEIYNFVGLGLLGTIIQNSRNIEDALENVCHFSNLMTNVFSMQLNRKEKTFEFEFVPSSDCEIKYPIATRQIILSAMAFSLKEYQLLTFKKITPITAEINFKLSEPFLAQRVFKTSIKENSKRFALTFDNQYLQQEILQADFQLLEMLFERANQIILKSSGKVSHQVKNKILQQYNNGFPAIANVANQLNISVRNLQRKLNFEKNSFNKIMEEVKKDLAAYYLKRDVSVKEISYLLGYSEISSFAKAFKKWTGKTPKSFKEKN